MSDKRRIVLEEGDFAEAPAGPPYAPVSNATTMPAGERAAELPPNVGLPAITRGAPIRVEPRAPSAGGFSASLPSTQGAGAGWLASPGKALLAAAAVGVMLAWVVTQVFGVAEIAVSSKTGADAVTGLWTGIVGIMFGGTLLIFDSAVAGAWDFAGRRFARAAPPMFGAGFLAGYLGNVIYSEIVQGVVEDAFRGGGFSDNDLRLYLARGLGWGLFGVGIGGTIGLLNKSRRQAINGALGGAIGGAGGGLIFQFVGANMGAGVGMSRLLGLIGIGALIALATRAVETVRREAWLQILAGGMSGKEFILYHAVTRLGASPECEIFLLKDAAIAKHHAQIEDQGTQRVISAIGGAPVLINQTPVSIHILRNGDQIQIGNTVISYSERAVVSPVAG